MKAKLILFFSDKQIKRITVINGFILLFFIIVASWKWSTLPSQLPLFYSLPRSNDQLGSPFKLLILPAFAIIFSMINFYLGFIFHTKERLATVILLIMSTTASILLFITFMKIIFLVS